MLYWILQKMNPIKSITGSKTKRTFTGLLELNAQNPKITTKTNNNSKPNFERNLISLSFYKYTKKTQKNVSFGKVNKE